MFGGNTEVDFMIDTIEILCTESHFLGLYMNESLKVKKIITLPQKFLGGTEKEEPPLMKLCLN